MDGGCGGEGRLLGEGRVRSVAVPWGVRRVAVCGVPTGRGMICWG